MLYMIQKKRLQAERGVGKGMAEEEGLPLEWNVEKEFLTKGVLKESWRHEYWMFLHRSYDIEQVCKEYLKGCQWILDYYTGKPVNRLWMFPAWLPPLWSDLAKYLAENTVDCSQIVTDSPTPEEQLAMVLPQSSFHLLPKEFQALPTLYPHAFPIQWELFSLGRKILWECEPLIPLIQPTQITSWIEIMLDA
jgi:5'-3' exonuclease